MKIKGFLINFLVIAVLTFFVAVIVSYLVSFIRHGTGSADWDSSARFAIIFGFVLSWVKIWEKKG